jgi:hypothetical protein
MSVYKPDDKNKLDPNNPQKGGSGVPDIELTLSDRINRYELNNTVKGLVVTSKTDRVLIGSEISEVLNEITSDKYELYNLLTTLNLTVEEQALVLLDYNAWQELDKQLDSILDDLIYLKSKNRDATFLSAGIILGQMKNRECKADKLGTIVLSGKQMKDHA